MPREHRPPPPAVLPLPERRPAPEDPQRETGCSINLGTPPPALPLVPISLGLITRVPQVDRPLVMRSKWVWGGPRPPPPPPSPLIHDVREEAVAWRTVAMAARAVRCGRCGASESAPGRSLGTSPASGRREARGFVWREGEVALKRTGDIALWGCLTSTAEAASAGGKTLVLFPRSSASMQLDALKRELLQGLSRRPSGLTTGSAPGLFAAGAASLWAGLGSNTICTPPHLFHTIF